MIRRENELIAQGVTVSHILEVRSTEQTADQEGMESPTIGQRVLHKEVTSWGVASDNDHTDDYHSGLVRAIPAYQSDFLATPPDAMDSDKVWNERAVSVVIAQELAAVAEMLDIATLVGATEVNDLSRKTGLSLEFIEGHHIDEIAEVVVTIATGANITLDDPSGVMRALMDNGNVVGFLDSGNKVGGSLIVSSYNLPCTKPGIRIAEMFPAATLSSGTKARFAKEMKRVLGPYRGWFGGVYSPGKVSVGDKVFVNVAPTTPPLPED